MEILSYLIVVTIFFAMNPLIGILFYIIPTLIALIFGKKNTLIIVLFNMIMGWFLPAWILLLLWAIFSEKKHTTEYQVNYKVSERSCQYCARFFPKEENRCPHCGKEQKEIE